MNLRFALLIIGICLTTNLCAQQEKSQKSLPSFTYKSNLINELEQAAIQGNPIAIYNLALAYHHGNGVSQSIEKAKYWYFKAAETDHAEVRYKIGRMLETGVFFKADLKLAKIHYEFAIGRGNNSAKVNLALIYINSERKEKLNQALSLLESAANESSIEAQINLVKLYRSNILGQPNHIKARHWLAKAADQENSWAENEMGNYYDSVKNYDAAFNWYDKSAERGNTDAMVNLARYFDLGLGVKRDTEKVLVLLQEASSLGNAKSKALLKTLPSPLKVTRD